MNTRSAQNGFTLMEMSIVLIIITLIIGSTLLARELTRGAQIRSIISDSDQIQNAVYSFQQKYQYLPGDFPRAESYWTPSDANCPALAPPATTASNLVTKTATCNGNGDGRIDTPGWVTNCAASEPTYYQQEPFRLWQHLVNADLYKGAFTGVHGATNRARYGIVGTNIPKSAKIKQVGYQIMNFDGDTATGGGAGGALNANWFQDRYYNVLFIGRQDDIDSCYEPNQPFLSSLETYDLDKKLDDGMPGTGSLRTFTINAQANCATSAVPATATYSMSNNDRSCSLIWLINKW